MTKLISIILGFLGLGGTLFGATILTTNSSDTLSTFRTNVNTSLTNLNTDLATLTTSLSTSIAGIVSTSSALTAGRVLYATGVNTMAGVATTTLSVGGSLLTSGTLGALVGGGNSTLSLNLANANYWTALQNFTTASTSQLTSTSTTYLATLGGNVGIGTTTPNWLLDVSGTRPSLTLSDSSATSGFKHWLVSSMGGFLYVGTSTDLYATSSPAALTISNKGQVSATESRIATSTAMVVDWNTTPNQVLIGLGGSATTIAFNNASTSGMTKRIVVCNPGSTGGALTFTSTVEWTGGTQPTQTTTANQCDAYSFIISAATSTTKIFGAMTAGFQ